MEDELLARARRGDADAFRGLTESHQRELRLHCYRLLGSVQDAEDVVQETLLAAWRGLERFEGRSSVRAWLYRIATNRCLNALRDRRRRPEPTFPPAPPEPTRVAEPTRLEPYPDALLDGVPDHAPGPESRYELKESVELAFVAGLQHLPPRQRTVLVLRDVLGFRAAQVAEMLGTSEPAVKGALRRARADLVTRLPADRESAPLPDSPVERELVGRFATALGCGDVDGMVALLTEDAWLTMPPQPHEYQGHAAIGAFLRHRADVQGAPLRTVPTRANTQPAFGCYLPDPETGDAHAYGLLVLTLEERRISAVTWFSDTGTFPYFGLPETRTGAATATT